MEEADGDGSSSSCEISTTISITLDQISTLRPNRRVSLVGTISLGSETHKEIKLRGSEKLALVKDDCILEDDRIGIVAYMVFICRTINMCTQQPLARFTVFHSKFCLTLVSFFSEIFKGTF